MTVILCQTNPLLFTLQLEMEEIRKVLPAGKKNPFSLLNVCGFLATCKVRDIKYKVVESVSISCNAQKDFTISNGHVSGDFRGCCRFLDPQPDYSAFREASYGHSTLEIKNRTHAFYHWNRNDDGKKQATDAFVLRNQYW